MWADVETTRDFLNFGAVAGLAAQMIKDAKGTPLSIGVSGGWGVGKSTMVKLIEKKIRDDADETLVFLNFNAWLYQGHDDAKAALMEEISRELMKRAKENDGLITKIRNLLARVNWFRLGKLGIEAYTTFKTGLPIPSIIEYVRGAVRQISDGNIPTQGIGEIIASDGLKKVGSFASTHKDDLKGILESEASETPPQMIQAFRSHFEEILKELNITLIVFVDDLDRCLPPTVIGTLEAMRLFLFMERTAFVIAADEQMIKESVRIHFKDARLDDNLVVSYFDKLIQVPLRVPPLGINEARAYLIMLFVDDSEINKEKKDLIAGKINERLMESWKGLTVTPDFAASLIHNCPDKLKAELAVADRLAKQMVVSPRISGNPRLIKRFLNTLSIRRKLASIYGIDVEEGILAKILLFERCATRPSFNFLVEMVNQSPDGIPAKIRQIEETARKSQDINFDAFDAWKSDATFVTEWLKLDPPFGNVDLRGALHVGRESLPAVADEDRVSQSAIKVVQEMLALSVKGDKNISERFSGLIPTERTFVMDKLIERAGTELSWGTPNILFGLTVAADSDADSERQLIDFLSARPSTSITASIIPRIRVCTWGQKVIEAWGHRSDLPSQVKKLLTQKDKR